MSHQINNPHSLQDNLISKSNYYISKNEDRKTIASYAYLEAKVDKLILAEDKDIKIQTPNTDIEVTKVKILRGINNPPSKDLPSPQQLKSNDNTQIASSENSFNANNYIIQSSESPIADIFELATYTPEENDNIFNSFEQNILEKGNYIFSESGSITSDYKDGKLTIKSKAILAFAEDYIDFLIFELNDNKNLINYFFADTENAISQQILSHEDPEQLLKNIITQRYNNYPELHQSSIIARDALKTGYNVGFADIIASVTKLGPSVSQLDFVDKFMNIYANNLNISYVIEILDHLAITLASQKQVDTINHIESYNLEFSLEVATSHPLNIIATDEKHEQLTDHEAAGLYNAAENIILVEYQNNKDFASHFAHETAHYVFRNLFKNEAKPYPKGQSEELHYYQSQVADIIANTLGINLNRSLGDMKSKFEIIKVELEQKLTDCYSIDEATNICPFIHSLGLSLQETEILHSLISVTLEYDINISLDKEIIVRLPELLAKGIDKAIILKYMAPIAHFWDNNITPIIEHLRDHYISECMEMMQTNNVNNIIGDNYYEFCVREILEN